METTIHLMVHMEPWHTPISQGLVVMHTLMMTNSGLYILGNSEVGSHHFINTRSKVLKKHYSNTEIITSNNFILFLLLRFKYNFLLN